MLEDRAECPMTRALKVTGDAVAGIISVLRGTSRHLLSAPASSFLSARRHSRCRRQADAGGYDSTPVY